MNLKFHYPRQASSILVSACLFTSAFGQSDRTIQPLPGASAKADISLKIGDEAPAIQYARWIKGTPVAAFDKNKIYVVEFWATWCGPCNAAMPHLSEVAKKYAGKVTFASFDVFEHSSKSYGETLDRVAKFVKAKGDNMDYNVGADTQDGFMSQNWLTASGAPGIPSTYIVQNNKVVWIGYGYPVPLDSILGEILSGRYDMRAYADKFKKERADQYQIREMLKPFYAALGTKNNPKALDELDKVMPKLPFAETYKPQLLMFAALMHNGDESTAIAFLKKWRVQAQADPSIAASVDFVGSNVIAGKDSLSPAAYQLALEYAKEFSGSKEAVSHPNSFLRYAVLAGCYWRLHNIPEAVSLQQKALDTGKEELAAIKPGNDEDMAKTTALIKQIQAGLDKYKSELK